MAWAAERGTSQVLAAGRRLNEVISAHHMDTNELLLSIPGIGRLTAARICLEVPHVSNFINSDHLASYIGFVPDVHGSDDNVYVRGITYRGRALLRSAFVESAWRAIGRDPAMGLAYSNYVKRGLKPNNAIIRGNWSTGYSLYCVKERDMKSPEFDNNTACLTGSKTIVATAVYLLQP